MPMDRNKIDWFSSLEKSFFLFEVLWVDMDDGNKLLWNCEKWKLWWKVGDLGIEKVWIIKGSMN